MRIIVDCDLDANGFPIGYHFVDTSDAAAIVTLTALQANKNGLAQSGWAQLSQLPGLPDGTRRWDVLITAQSKKTAPAALTALALTA